MLSSPANAACSGLPAHYHRPVTNLPEHVAQSLRSRQLLLPGEAVLVAVSGGLDSMVLLRVLHQLSRRTGWKLTVAHLNHQLRGRSSAADERLVRRAAANLGLPAVIDRADVRAFARAHKLSLEMAARQLRHYFLARTAVQKAIPTIALAHHADDQLELFFLRLLRGSGSAGLAGMKWRSPSPANPEVALVRPLLDLPKAALREYAVEQKLRFREDASNARLNIQRNRLRHELLPLLRRHYQPALDKTVLRLMDILGAEAELVMRAAHEWLRQARNESAVHRLKPQRRACRLDLGHPSSPRPRHALPFGELPAAVQRRSLQLQLLSLGIEPDYELVEQLRLAANRPVSVGVCPGTARTDASTLEQPWVGGRNIGPHKAAHATLGQVTRSSLGIVHLETAGPPQFEAGSLPMRLTGKTGEAVFEGVRLRWRITAGKAATSFKARAGREFFDADKVGTQILVRHWRPGDRFQPIGLGRPVKLQDLFVNQKVARPLRRRLLVAQTHQGELFWVEKLRISERFKLTETTIRRLHWSWLRP